MSKSKPKSGKTTKPDPKPANPPRQTVHTYILFGTDEYAKPRAARFIGTDPEPLAKAAEAMGLRLIEVTSSELADLAKRLPMGRPHASGSALVPFIKGDLYSELVVATVGDQQQPRNSDGAARQSPQTWDEVGPGQLVIVKESHECGWWEAIVVERNGDLVTVRYRDFASYPNMVRHRSTVALISSAASPSAAA